MVLSEMNTKKQKELCNPYDLEVTLIQHLCIHTNLQPSMDFNISSCLAKS